MASFHNIEKLVGKDYYTGYGAGVWRITKAGKGWQARRGTELQFRPTLADVSRLLDAESAVETARISADLKADREAARAALLINPFAFA